MKSATKYTRHIKNKSIQGHRFYYFSWKYYHNRCFRRFYKHGITIMHLDTTTCIIVHRHEPTWRKCMTSHLGKMYHKIHLWVTKQYIRVQISVLLQNPSKPHKCGWIDKSLIITAYRATQYLQFMKHRVCIQRFRFVQWMIHSPFP